MKAIFVATLLGLVACQSADKAIEPGTMETWMAARGPEILPAASDHADSTGTIYRPSVKEYVLIQKIDKSKQEFIYVINPKWVARTFYDRIEIIDDKGTIDQTIYGQSTVTVGPRN